MNTAEVVGELRKFLAEEHGLTERIEQDQPLFTSGMLSSIHVIQLMMMVEQKYGIEFNTGDLSLAQIDTLAKIAAFIEKSVRLRT